MQNLQAQQGQKKVTVTLRAESGTLKGSLIEYLQKYPNSIRGQVFETLLFRIGTVLFDNSSQMSQEKQEAERVEVAPALIYGFQRFLQRK